jgi:hypothetical protein
VFAPAADRLRARGEAFASRADLLGKASAHWLRHTSGSHMADQQVDLRLARRSRACLANHNQPLSAR